MQQACPAGWAGILTKAGGKLRRSMTAAKHMRHALRVVQRQGDAGQRIERQGAQVAARVIKPLCADGVIDRRLEIVLPAAEGQHGAGDGGGIGQKVIFHQHDVRPEAVAQLLRRFPNEREGELARRHAALVRAETLVEIATEIGLGDHLSLGDSERTPGTNVRPNILADALEALLGAIFLDAGLEAAAASVAVLWGARLSSRVAVPRDPKTALQEWAQARRLPLPVYLEVDREGPPHAPVFVVDAILKGHDPARGRGGSKREAERLAAMTLLERLNGA